MKIVFKIENPERSGLNPNPAHLHLSVQEPVKVFKNKVYISILAKRKFHSILPVVSFSDDEFVIGPCRSTATHDNDGK